MTASWEQIAERSDAEANWMLRRILELEGRSGDHERAVEILAEYDKALEQSACVTV